MATGPYETHQISVTKLWEKKLADIECVTFNDQHEEIWVRTRDYEGHPLVSVTYKGKKNGRFGKGVITSSGKGICTDRTRDCIVATERNRILTVDRLGYKIKETLVPNAVSLQGVVHCPDVDAYLVADSSVHCVWRVDARTRDCQKISDSSHQFNSPGFLCHNEETLVVSDCNNHELKWLSPAGELTRTSALSFSGVGRLEFPQDICFDYNGSLLVCDQDNRRIVRITLKNEEEKYDILLNPEQLNGLKPCCIDTIDDMLVVGLRGHHDRLACFSYNV